MRTIPFYLICIILVLLCLSSSGQISVNSEGASPDGSAMLDVSSTTRGLLLPRMTSSQRNSIDNPAEGLLVYQTEAPSGYYYFTGTNWVSLTGAGAGAISAFSCIDYDGNAYPTFTIGTQVWMAENLRVTHYRNGDAIPNVTVDGSWWVLTSGAYCWYANDQSGNSKYGVLYNWFAVDDSRGLCPSGWHEPTDAEFSTLTTYLGGETVAGGKMKSVSALWNPVHTNEDATNNSGFSGLPGGYRYGHGTFEGAGDNGFWWTSTEINISYAEERNLNYSTPEVGHVGYGKDFGFSVRCIRD